MKSVVTAVLTTAVIVTGCSSSGSPSPPSSSAALPSSSVPATSPAPAETLSTELLTPPPDPDVEAAKDWINTAPHRIDVELMIVTALQVRRQLSGDPSVACGNLIDAAFALDDEFPAFDDPGRNDVMIDQLVEAASSYNLAGQACSIGVHSGVKKNLAAGDAAVHKAEVRAKALHTTI